MQNPASKILESLQQKFSIQKEVEKAEEMFSYQPFVLEYRPLKILAMVARPILGLFSILTGAGFLVDKFDKAMPLFLAVSLATLILVMLEGGKNLLEKFSLKKLCSDLESMAGWLLLSLPLALVTLSVFFSVNGAELLYQRLDKTLLQTEAKHVLQVDSVKAHFKGLVVKEEKELAAYKASVTWNGKINIYNKTNQEVIHRHNDNLASLQQQREKALSMLESEQIESIEKLRKESKFNAHFWIITSGIVEGFILLSLWFSVFYKHRVKLEKTLLESTVPANESVTATVPAETASVTLQNSSIANVNSELDKLKEMYGIMVSRGYVIRCEYCGDTAIMRSPHAKYCCESHRKLAHKNEIQDSKSLEIPFFKGDGERHADDGKRHPHNGHNGKSKNNE